MVQQADGSDCEGNATIKLRLRKGLLDWYDGLCKLQISDWVSWGSRQSTRMVPRGRVLASSSAKQPLCTTNFKLYTSSVAFRHNKLITSAHAFVLRHVDPISVMDPMRHPPAVLFAIRRKFADEENKERQRGALGLLIEDMFDRVNLLSFAPRYFDHIATTRAVYRCL